MVRGGCYVEKVNETNQDPASHHLPTTTESWRMSAQRNAENQAVFRTVNENIADLSDTLFAGDGQTEWEFFCECGDAGCAERMVVPIRAYRDVRENGRRFLLLPGHENRAVERVVERQPAYFVVETFGRAGEVADAPAGKDGQAPLTAPPV
jgi:hypothetical protein